jgi:tight adherence protein B
VLSGALLCAAGALLIWPPADRPAGVRAILPRDAVRRVPRQRMVLAAAVGTAVLGGAASAPVVAALAAGAVLAAGRAWERRGTRILDERRVRGLAEALAGFAADLRAGRSRDEAALAAGRACADDTTAEALVRALRVPEAVSRPAPGGGACEEAMSRIAAGVRLSVRTGCSLAAVACAVEDDLRARLRHQQDLRTAVAAPRASAVLLAGLPLLALAMGSGMGADPWHVLVATPVGNLLLVLGAGLEVAGLTWSGRLARSALR